MEKKRAIIKSITLTQDVQCRWIATCEYQASDAAHVAISVVALDEEYLNCATINMCHKIAEHMDSKGYIVTQHSIRPL